MRFLIFALCALAVVPGQALAQNWTRDPGWLEGTWSENSDCTGRGLEFVSGAVRLYNEIELILEDPQVHEAVYAGDPTSTVFIIDKEEGINIEWRLDSAEITQRIYGTYSRKRSRLFVDDIVDADGTLYKCS